MAQATKKRASAAKRKKPAVSHKTTSRSRASTGVSSRKKARARKGAVRQPALRDNKRARATATATLANTAAISHMSRLMREVGGIVCLFSALIALLALITFHMDDPGWSHTGSGVEIHNSVGRAGAWFADVMFYMFGYMAYLIPLVLALSGWLLFRDDKKSVEAVYRPYAFVRVIGVALMLLSASGLADLHFAVSEGALPRGTFGGGILGTAVAWRLVAFLHHLGTTLLLLALFFSSLTLAFGTSWLQLIETLGAAMLKVIGGLQSGFDKAGEKRTERQKQREADEARAARSGPVSSDRGPFGGMKRGEGLAHAFAGGANDEEYEVGDALMDTIDADEKPRGLAAALAAAREKAIQGTTMARNAAKSLSGGAPQSTRNISIEAVAAQLDEADALMSESSGSAGTARSALIRSVARAVPDNSSVSSGVTAATPQKAAIVQPVSAAPQQRKKKIAIKQRVEEQKQSKLFLDVPDSDLPALSLLDVPEPQRPGFSDAELESLSRLLEEKLAEFRIAVEVVAVHPGPVITRFEMQLAPGIKASRITGLSQDIARSMSLVSVRVVEVIAGKSTIGIEVPNDHREIVQLSEMLQSREYAEQKSPLTLVLGKDISGQPVTADLGRMPHLLVAGTTGSGKSVAVNAMLISLLYKATAKDLRLILIDPKMLELNVYDGIPHLLTPVVTDMKDAANALRWCVGEMERRYTVMAELKVRNIAGYNKKVNEAIKAGEPIVDPLYQAELSLTPTAAPPTLEPMPFIVVVVDEFADMMMQVGKKAEELIARIAQKARAAGIHLILATQRPSVDVITGLIKANVPTRIAFQVSSKVDSRTIIDQGGAESLLGHGDMLFLPPGTALPNRVHGAFVDDHEVQNVIAHIKQTGEPNYIEEIVQESQVAIPGISGGEGGGDESDALYDQAVAIVLESRKASISYVQRRLKIGYNRAARMVEEMEAAGVVSTVTSSGTREVLAPPPS
ncbi:MAG: DNA translocase FtsK 4TM domain-containing protein [Granulosicoccus sp.]